MCKGDSVSQKPEQKSEKVAGNEKTKKEERRGER